MTYLLDVNVLIALLDPTHVAHEAAHLWFGSEGAEAWATCPVTENGVIRIVGNPKYPNTPGSTKEIAEILREFCTQPGHIFWPDDISLVSSAHIDITQVLTSGQVTDTYLLALAARYGGKLATFDRRLSVKAVKGGKHTLTLIPP